VYGGSGNDTLYGLGSSDVLYGGTGDDTYIIDTYTYPSFIENSNEGIDTVQSSVTWTLYNNNLENLTLTGSDAINGTGNEIGNTITGNSANNILEGLDGSDTLFGNGGDDILYGGADNDQLDGGEGNDLIFGDEVLGGLSAPVGNDTLYGGNGNDLLYGGRGNDSLVGGSSNDFLSGAYSNSTTDLDTLTGGTEADTFDLGFNGFFGSEILYLGDGYATITDFNACEGDKIRIGGSITDYILDLMGQDTFIKLDGDLIALVQNTSVSVSDFV
jgi:Ca2+-binding RTX toxin-like protein